MPGGCYPKYQPCGDPNLVPKTGEETFGSAPAQLSQNLSIDLVDLRLVPWLPASLPDGPNPPSYVKIPVPPTLYKNEALIATAYCANTDIENNVSVLVPAGGFSSLVSVALANDAARAFWAPFLEAELNCTTVTNYVITPVAVDSFTGFVQEQAGGTWFASPWLIEDGFLVNIV